MARKVTLTLDEETIQRLESASASLGKSKSEVLKEAVAGYRILPDRLNEAERQRMLKALAVLRNLPPSRPDEEVQQEIEEIRAARRSGGRRSPVD